MFANNTRALTFFCRLLMLTGCLCWSQLVTAASQAVTLVPGQQQLLTFTQELDKVAVSNPAVAEVKVSGEKELLLTARSPGEVSLRVWLVNSNRVETFDYLVSSTSGKPSPLSLQVQTDIRVVEVNRQKLNALGVYYSKVFGGTGVGIAPGGTNFLRPSGIPAQATGLSTEGFNLFRFGASSTSIINALESGGFAYTLAEPSLVSLSGQNATFLSGGEFPIPVSGDNGDIEIEYKQFGVSLSLTPTVVSENQIVLRVAPEVSDLDFTAGVSSGGVSVPGLRVRKTETTVSMAPGESFIISGLVSRSTFNNSDRLPGLGNIPVLGALFRNDRISSEQQELIMIVTPHLVSAQRELPAEAENFGKKYEYSGTDWIDMVTNSKDGTEPLDSGLSW